MAGNATRQSTATTTPQARNSDNNYQWRVFLGIAMLIASYLFRVELVRFILRLTRRAIPTLLMWIKEFENMLLRPLSWVVFVLLVWVSTYIMDLSRLLNIEKTTIASLINLCLGFPLIWTVICFCNYVTWGIIRVKGWHRSSSSNNDDDYNRIMIITEGIRVIKILLVVTIVSSFMIDGIGAITNFDSSQIATVAVLTVELVFVLGAHTWLKNIMGGLMALIDENIKGGSHIRFQGYEGVVEQLFLQGFALRQYDKGLVYIPNGMLLEHLVEIQTKTLDRRVIIDIHLAHSTSVTASRLFIQKLDGLMERLTKRGHKRRSTVLRFDQSSKRSGTWDMFGVVEKSRAMLMTGASEIETATPRFWISLVRPYMIEVVYETVEQHMIPLMSKKTEVILEITNLMATEQIELHRNGVKGRVRMLPPLHRRESETAMSTTGSLDVLDEEHLSEMDGNQTGLRQRRLRSS